MVSGCDIIHGISDKEVKKMKVKHILAVGAAGVTLLGASTLLASISDELTVYASQNTTENPNPENFRSTQWRYRDKSNLPLTFKYAEKYSGEPGEFPEFTYVKSYSDGGIWVHEFALKAGATPPASNDNTYVNTNSTGRNNTDHVDFSDTNSNNQKNEYKWLTVNGKPQLYINNNLATGWQKVDGKIYYFDDKGVMKTGILELKDKRYYFDEDGVKKTGWVNEGGKDYYITDDGSKPTTIIAKGEKIYYVKEGIQQTGLQQIDKKWYYLLADGSRKTGLVQDANKKWYYITNDGERKVGLVKDSEGAYHYLTPEGERKTGSITIDGVTYRLADRASSKPGWNKMDGKWYYYDAEDNMKTGWVKDGSWYYLDASGVMQTGWQKIDGVWYYLDGSGAMQTGWLNQGGTWYYLNNSGAMKTGWLNQSGTWYYLDGSGAMKTGWYQVGGKWYYSYSSGVLAVSTTINGYTVNSNGEWV